MNTELRLVVYRGDALLFQMQNPPPMSGTKMRAALDAHDDLVAALRAAVNTYREQWAHPGTDRTGHLLPAPEWVTNARAVLAKVHP